MDRRSLGYYLLLNVLVSACVTAAILFWYDRNYRATLSPVQPAAPQAAATAAPQAEVSVRIVSISGAGTLAETVIIKNFGAGEVNLAGWQLQDEDGNIFIFPPMSLIANGAVQVHTATGTNSAVDLYWNLQAPVWESGEQAQLTDAQDTVRATYQVP